MIEAAKQGVKRTKKVLALNLLRGLRKRRLGTPAVEKMAKNLMEENERQENVVIKLMDIAVRSAEEKAKKAKMEADRSMKEAKRELPAGWQIAAGFIIIVVEVRHYTATSLVHSHWSRNVEV